MPNAIERLLSSLTLNDEAAQVIQELKVILHTPSSIFRYITERGEPLTSGKYSGVSACGKSLTIVLTIPRKIDLNDPESVSLHLTKELLTKSLYQSRVGSIWRQTAAMIFLLRAVKSENHPLHRFYQLLVKHYDVPPFHERGGEIVWEKMNIPVLSVLPLLIHGTGHLVIMNLTEVVNEIDTIACIQHWMDCLKGGYQDMKLATQKHLTNWLPIGLNSLPSPQNLRSV
ncbi:hypothetical protein J6590_081539 [Homalodisca vitripennis]|nr:hypothetical protein J6590_081539 [Homalodisca vitripennis]